jgi:hypothetical protein
MIAHRARIVLAILVPAVLANACQVAFHVAFRWCQECPQFVRQSEWLEFQANLTFILAPGVVAAVASILILHRLYRGRRQRLPTWVAGAVVVTALANAYVGLFIIVNTWGT